MTETTSDQARLAQIEARCLAAKKDLGEIRWVRMFATDILKLIDPKEDWEAVAYCGKSRPVPVKP